MTGHAAAGSPAEPLLPPWLNLICGVWGVVVPLATLRLLGVI